MYVQNRTGITIYTVSKLLLVVGIIMAASIVVALVYQETETARIIAACCLLNTVIAFIGLISCYRYRFNSLTIRDGFLVVVTLYIVVSILSSILYYSTHSTHTFTDAFFESISGFTTTGATVLSNIESTSKSVLFWRSLTQWLGGMGIIVVILTILPKFGVGGMRTMPIDPTGPMSDKIFPRMSENAKIIWLIYILLSALEFGLLVIAGLDWFNALTHTFTTISTGGFSPLRNGIGDINSLLVESIVIVFMVLSSINFAVYFQIVRRKTNRFSMTTEMYAFVGIFIIATALLTLSLFTGSIYGSLGESFRFSVFQVGATITTTGFSSTDYSTWPTISKLLLILLMIIGGCAGSTAGGLKVIRLLVLIKQSVKELQLLIFPKGIFTVKIGNRLINKDIVFPVFGFFFLYTLLITLTTLVLASYGHEFDTAISSSVAIVSNHGPGTGSISGPTGNYSTYPNFVKWWLSFAMLAGRLEIYSVLILLTPIFYKR